MTTLNLEASIHAALVEDIALAADLATYVGEPAVFTGHVPEASPRPYVFIHGVFSAEPFDTKTTRGREAFARVDAVADATGSTIVVNRIIERVRALLHRSPPAVSDFAGRVADVSGPIIGESDASVYVRTLTLRLLLEET